MTFLFADIVSGEACYVNASDLADAFDIFESHRGSSVSSDFEHLHIYVCII